MKVSKVLSPSPPMFGTVPSSALGGHPAGAVSPTTKKRQTATDLRALVLEKIPEDERGEVLKGFIKAEDFDQVMGDKR